MHVGVRMCDSSVEAPLLVGYVGQAVRRITDRGAASSKNRHSHPSNGVMRGFEIQISRLNEMGDWGGNGRKEVKAERGEGERERRGGE